MRKRGIEAAKPIHPASWFIADLLSQARSRADDGQPGSNLGRPDSRYYFRLADHPLSFVAGYSSRTWEFLCLFPVERRWV